LISLRNSINIYIWPMRSTIQIQEILRNLQISSLNEIQEAALAVDPSNDMILIAPTGSGKTLAFLLPLLKFLDSTINGAQVLIVCPSRELVLQTAKVFGTMKTGFKINACYGGHSVQVETNNLSTPPAVLIGTPGRLVHLLRKKTFTTQSIKTLILDEFDKSLEFGFQDDMVYLTDRISKSATRILTSATQAIEIPEFAGLRSPVTLNFTGQKTAAILTIKTVKAIGTEKSDTLYRLLCMVGHESTLVFCNQRETVESIRKMLSAKGLQHDIYHGKMEQDERERTLFRFRNGSIRVLITTDLASRGLDIPEIRHIIHYQMPQTHEAFIHRNGRTARMFASGTAYFILSEKEYLPRFIKEDTSEISLPKKAQLPPMAEWETLYIAGGKKDKINKTDIVGLLCKKGRLTSKEIGLIDVRDYASFVAIQASKTASVLKLLANETIKKKRLKIEKAN
jgi:ATP-independent RNA helicase DbpA